MISFTSFPAAFQQSSYAHTRHHPDTKEDMMDVDDLHNFGLQDSKLTCPGEYLTSSQAFMRGHGTYVDNEEVIASVAGTVERVNKLVTVRGIRSRYNPEVGDLVVGRITEVPSVFPGIETSSGVDLATGTASEMESRRKLETGRCPHAVLRNGQLVVVPPILVRRLKSHFISLPCGVDLILGLNGYIWVSKHVKQNEQEGEEGFDAEAVYSNVNDNIDVSTRTAISRVTNIVRILASHFVPLTDALLLEAYEWTVEHEAEATSTLQEDFGDALVASVTTGQ
ncbi:hypothetical protein NLJ89_g4216 [Agrocybe chaxingu]|uniref:Ribosomal RNA-processing protein 4 n=1 Tax=Agrocybe chaxingu TaxID=84603 RepID=A0A9W8K4E4_9AGAR|nr:hypothetical protein NLJ89_g4216 [Agrocybe chaxingu]